MAGCHTQRKRFNAFLDGELPPKKRVALEDHLVACAACRGELASWKALDPILERLEVSSPPPGMAVRIMAEARRRAVEKRFWHLVRHRPTAVADWPWVFKALGTAAVFVLMLFLGIYVSTKGWLPGSSDRRSDPATVAFSTTEGLEWFAPGPPGSLVSGYLAMAGPPGSTGGAHPKVRTDIQ
jgi:anti-sigma factor RsiW